MEGTKFLRRLIAFDRWANAWTHETIAPVAAAVPKAVTLLAHIYTGWDAWLDRIQQTERKQVWFPELSLDECAKLVKRVEKRWDDFLDGLDEDWADNEYTAKIMDGSVSNFAMSEIVMQLVTHGSHHRGQINTLIRQAGGKPENTTFMRYVVTTRG